MKIIIAALGYNRVIGEGGKLPWWAPEEYQQFLDFIAGQTVIFGRKTYGNFSKNLPAKRIFVISQQNINHKNVFVCASVEDALRQAEQHPEDIYIAGGGTIYAQTLDVADKMYLSYMKGEYKGDTFFPPVDPSQWKIESRVDHQQFEFVIYTKIENISPRA